MVIEIHISQIEKIPIICKTFITMGITKHWAFLTSWFVFQQYLTTCMPFVLWADAVLSAQIMNELFIFFSTPLILYLCKMFRQGKIGFGRFPGCL